VDDAHDKIRRKEEMNNEILKHTRYYWLKDIDYFPEKERDHLMSIKSLTCRHLMPIISRSICRDYGR
jgi:hypothetical protein